MIDPFSTTTLGTTAVRVTRFGLGTAPLGGWPDALPTATAVATVRAAWDAGVRFFDTAPLYGHGSSERHLGAVLADKRRDDFAVCTKVGRVLVPGEGPTIFKDVPPVTPVFDFSADGVRRSFDSSLERLGLDRVDVVLIHDPDDHHEQALREAYPVIADLRAQGVVGAIGAGMNVAEPLARFATEGDFDCFLLAGRYTLFEQDSLDDLLPLCLERKVSIIAGGVYNSGLLANPRPGTTYDYAPADAATVDRARLLEAACDEIGVPLRAAAIQFPLAHPAVACVAIGSRSPAELEDNVRMLRTPVPAGLWDLLKDRGLMREDAPIPASRQ